MLVAQGNYGTQLPGLFQGGGIADTSYKYQLLICDVSFYSGFFISGYTSNCFKQCDHWCGDLGSPTSGQRQVRHRMRELPSIVMVTDH